MLSIPAFFALATHCPQCAFQELQHVSATVTDITPSNRHPWVVSPLAGGEPCKHPEENQVNLPNPIKFGEIYANPSESNKIQANLNYSRQI